MPTMTTVPKVLFAGNTTNYFLLLVLLVCTLLLPVAQCSKGSSSSSNSNNNNIGPSSIPNTHKRSSSTKSNTNSGGGLGIGTLISIYEHEYFDSQRNTWIGGSGNSTRVASKSRSQRWTSSPTNYRNAEAVDDEGDPPKHHRLPPPKIPAPDGYRFTSNWNIDISGSGKDQLGWEYFVDDGETGNEEEGGLKRRRRHWLRTAADASILDSAKDKDKDEDDTRPSKPTKTAKSTAPPPLPLPKPHLFRSNKHFQRIRDSFNFKGYGLSVTKSLLSLSSGGFSLRMPITSHFDAFDRRPYLPLVTSSIGAFLYQSKVAGCVILNGSVPMEVVKCVLVVVTDWTMFLGRDLVGKTLLLNMWRLGVWLVRWLVLFLSWVGGRQGQGAGGIRDGAEARDEPLDSAITGGRTNSDGDHTHDQTTLSSSSSSKPLLTARSLLIHPYTTVLFHLRRNLPSPPPRRFIVYNPGINERLGASMSLQISQEGGWELRIRWWVCYLPTFEYIGDTIGKGVAAMRSKTAASDVSSSSSSSNDSGAMDDGASGTQTEPHITSSSSSMLPFEGKMYQWLRSKAGCMGMHGNFFAPEPPFYSCSALLSLSGFYYGGTALRSVCRVPFAMWKHMKALGRRHRGAGLDRVEVLSSLRSSKSGVSGLGSDSLVRERTNEIRSELIDKDDEDAEQVDVRVKV